MWLYVGLISEGSYTKKRLLMEPNLNDAANREIRHAVLGKTIVFILLAAVVALHIEGLSSPSGLNHSGKTKDDTEEASLLKDRDKGFSRTIFKPYTHTLWRYIFTSGTSMQLFFSCIF